MIFLTKSVSRSQAHLANRKRIGWSIGLNSWTNWILYGTIPRSLCKIRLNGVSEMCNCGELMLMGLLTHTFCYSSNVLDCTRYFWLFTVWFIDEDASFFHFFDKIMNILSWRSSSFLFFQNPYAIFAHILQHFHDFRSNVAIFPGVVQAFGGRIKLIICQTSDMS